MARLLYGCGLRVTECCTLRVHDIDLGRGQILVRGGKGNKDRVVMLPRTVRQELEQQLVARRTLHERDLARGVARVDLPEALERKYPRAAQALEWQFVFASRQLSHCPRTGRIGRHHILDGSLQRAVAQAGVAAALDRAIHCHTFATRTRHSTQLCSSTSRSWRLTWDDSTRSGPIDRNGFPRGPGSRRGPRANRRCRGSVPPDGAAALPAQ